MMNVLAKQEAIIQLRSVAVHVQQADALFRNGESVRAIQALQQAREENQHVIVTLLGNCLEAKLSTIQYPDAQQREANLPELARLLKFAIATLCPDCRRLISDQIRVALLEAA